MSVFISVLICTYNRANILAHAIESLCQQSVTPSEYEIIVVDNNSTDNTRAVVEQFSQRQPNLRYIFEPTQGLSHARNRAWQEARADYVGYIDDDGKAPPEWLEVAQEIIKEFAPGMFGGPYYAWYDSQKPYWWKDTYRSTEHAEKARALTGYQEYLSGNNMFFRRSLLSELGGFDPQFGMSGNKIATCEERELLFRIRDTKPNELIYYDPKLYIRHLVPANKMSFKWLVRHRFASGRSHGRMYNANKPLSKRELLGKSADALRTLIPFPLQAIRRDRTQYPYIQNYCFEKGLRQVREFGSLYEQWQMLFERG